MIPKQGRSLANVRPLCKPWAPPRVVLRNRVKLWQIIRDKMHARPILCHRGRWQRQTSGLLDAHARIATEDADKPLDRMPGRSIATCRFGLKVVEVKFEHGDRAQDKGTHPEHAAAGKRFFESTRFESEFGEELQQA